MPIAARLKEFLDGNNVDYETLWHTPTYTAQGAAEKMHVSGKLLAKAVVVKATGGFVMAVLEAPDHLDLKKLGDLAQRSELRLATEREFEELFPGCEPGAIPPFGNLFEIPVFVDRKLSADPEIVFNAGSYRDAIKLRFDDFTRLVRPVAGDLVK
jgi:Ala-tRNA(Pro) deacylase